jgi:hypothetical protein
MASYDKINHLSSTEMGAILHLLCPQSNVVQALGSVDASLGAGHAEFSNPDSVVFGESNAESSKPRPYGVVCITELVIDCDLDSSADWGGYAGVV